MIVDNLSGGDTVMKVATIRQKIEMLRSYAHVFEFERDEKDGEKYILAMLNDDDVAYYMHLVAYGCKSVQIGEQCRHKELSMQTDRYYFLELANSFITDTQRLEICMSLLGRRQFSMQEEEICVYGCEGSDELLLHASKVRANPKQEQAQHVLFQRFDTNLNLYDAKIFSFSTDSYALLTQTNIAEQSKTQKEFLVKLSAENIQRIETARSPAKIIETIFAAMGLTIFEVQEYVSSSFSSTEVEEFLYVGNEDEHVHIQDFLRSFRNLPMDRLISQRENLTNYYESAYAIVFKLVQNGYDEESMTQLADLLEKYAFIIEKEEIFYGVHAALRQLVELFSAQKSARVLCERQAVLEVLLDVIEDLYRWQETVYAQRARELAFLSADLIHNVKYLVAFVKEEAI